MKTGSDLQRKMHTALTFLLCIGEKGKVCTKKQNESQVESFEYILDNWRYRIGNLTICGRKQEQTQIIRETELL